MELEDLQEKREHFISLLESKEERPCEDSGSTSQKGHLHWEPNWPAPEFWTSQPVELRGIGSAA